MVNTKIRTDVSVFYTGTTGASVTPENRIPRKKRNIKSLTTSPPGKDPIPNKDENTLGIEKYQSLPLHLPKFRPGYKSFKNEADYDRHESTDTSRNDKYDTSRTDKDYSMENL